MKYIEAEALKKEIAKAPVWTALTITEKINNAPSIDIEPKRGEWIEFDTKWGRSLYYCTNCMETSEVPTAFGKPLYNFCPNCGADMREREGE